jgi:hypothetical protein
VLELVRALAIAWKNLAAYPPGHPALVASMGLAQRRLQEALAGGGTVMLGVARDGLVHGQEKITSSHAQDLGRALYGREVAVLRLDAGVDAAELEVFLRLMGTDGARGERPPLHEELAAKGLTHVHVQSVDFSQVRLTDDAETPPGPAPAAATLWEDVLRAVMAGHALSPRGRRLVDSGEAATGHGVAVLLDEVLGMAGGTGAGNGPGAAAPTGAGDAPGNGPPAGDGVPSATADRVRVGARLAQAASAHFRGTSAERVIAARDVAELVRALPPDIRDTLVVAALKALAADESAAEALSALAGGLAPDTVLQALRRIKDEVPLSSHALRLLHALSAAAPSLRERRVEPPDPALLAELAVFFREDDIDRYNPEEHQALLETAAIDVPVFEDTYGPELGERLDTVTEDAVAERLSHTAVELFARFAGRDGTGLLLSRIDGLFRGFITSGRLEPAATLAEDLRRLGDEGRIPPAARAQIDEAMAGMATTESVAAMFDALNRRGPQAAALGRRLMDALGKVAARAFLVALAEEQDKSRRRRILDLLVSLGPVIAAPATELLSDDRWYVVRNMIVLLQRVGDASALPAVRRCAEHYDLRVRLEAIKWLLAYDPEVPRDLLEKAIHDPDPKLAEAAVALAGSYGIKEAVGPLLKIVEGLDLMGKRRSLRVKALKALGELADPSVLPGLERYFANSLVPLVALEERRVAFRSLLSYPPEARRPLVERGLRSRDPEIRRICEALRRGQPPRAREADA